MTQLRTDTRIGVSVGGGGCLGNVLLLLLLPCLPLLHDGGGEDGVSMRRCLHYR